MGILWLRKLWNIRAKIEVPEEESQRLCQRTARPGDIKALIRAAGLSKSFPSKAEEEAYKFQEPMKTPDGAYGLIPKAGWQDAKISEVNCHYRRSGL